MQDAYLGCRRRTIGNGTSESPETKHTHEGSINNLCLTEIKDKMNLAY
jgi:argininosuccinate lyase